MAFDLGKYVNLQNALKLLGVVLLGWGIFNAWTTANVATKFLMISGPVAWYVGVKFDYIYPKKT